MRRILRRLLAVILLLPLLTLLLLGGLLGTTAGSRWLLAQVPGLSVEGFRGSLLADWRSDQLRWHDAGTQVTIGELQVQLKPACLSERRLCLGYLRAGSVALVLPAGGETSSAPVSLPDIQLPLDIELSELTLGELLLDGQSLLQGLSLRARLDRSGLQVDELQLAGTPVPDWKLAIRQLRLGLHGDWPLQTAIELEGPAADGSGSRWPLQLQVEGQLTGELNLQLASSGWLTGNLHGQLAPLDPQLPASLQGELALNSVIAGLPPSLQPDAVQLQASGNLQNGWQLKLASRLGGAQGMPLKLQALLRDSGLRLDSLTLSDGEGGQLQAHGTLNWSQTLNASLQVSSAAFLWQRLHPAIPAELGLQGLKLSASLEGEQYQGQLGLQLDTPAGAGRLDTPFQGDFQRIRLAALQWQQGNSRLTGDLGVDFEPLRWQAALQASDFDPAAWVSELPGRIGGTLQASGTGESAQAQWDFTGQLRQQKLTASGRLDWAGSRLEVPQLDLRLGANRIDGNLSLDQQLAAALDIQLPRLDQLWPGLRGRLQGSLLLSGQPQLPQGRIKLSGQAGYGAWRIGRLSLEAGLDNQLRGQLELTASDLLLDGQRWKQLALSASGDSSRQQARIEGNGRDGERILLNLDGILQDGNWSGSLSAGRIQLAGMDWRQQSAARLQRSAAGRMDLGAHCWTMQQASLCAGEQQLAPVTQLDLRLQDLPLAALPGERPAGSALNGMLSGAVQLVLEQAGPRGLVWLDAGQGSLSLPAGSDSTPLPLDWQRARLEARLQPQLIDTRLELAGPQLGQLQVLARIDPRSQKLEGSYRFDALQLALLRPMLQDGLLVEGTLQGKGQLGGNLQAPQVHGSISLSGKVGGDALPMAFDDLALRMDIQGVRATLAGSWRSGEAGRGEIDGQLQWQPQPLVDIRIRGSRLEAQVEPWAELEVEPDLRLALTDGQLQLSGEVAVPRGSIEIRQLPESAVGLSPDARFIDEEVADTSLPLQADIRLRIGADKLTFSGFGLKASLRGNLRVRDNLEARGSLQLVDGRYKAWGQDLSLRRARLLFTGALERPQLDIEAVRSFKEENLVAGIRLTGPADAPQTEVFSEPSLAQEEALSWLILGRAPGTQSEDQNMLSRAALALGLAGGAPVAQGLATRLGIKDFQLESSGSGLTTSVVASGYLTSKLSLRYGVGVFEPASTLALRYELSKRVYLEAASGIASSLDLFYRKDY